MLGQGTFDINGNLIGSMTSNNSIVVTASGSAFIFDGIILGGTSPTNTSTITNNNVGGIGLTVSGVPATPGSIRCISVQGTVNNHNYVINGNTVGSTTVANNITADGNVSGSIIGIVSFSNAFNQVVTNNTVSNLTSTNSGTTNILWGILLQGTSGVATFNVSGNIVQNLTLGTGNTANFSLNGIQVTPNLSTTGTNIIRSNTVRNLLQNNPTAGTSLAGMVIALPTVTSNTIERNFLHSFNMTTTTLTGSTVGILLTAGTTNVRNNMIRLGVDGTGASITSGFGMVGIQESGGNNNIHFNSVYIGGSGVSSGTANTFAFASTVTTGARNYISNIFYNARSNGAGTGKHYAITVGGTLPNPAGLMSNYNDLFVSGTGGFIGLFNATDQLTLANWRTATGNDFQSVSGDPKYILPTGTSATVDLHIQAASATPVEGGGQPVVGATDDFDGQIRATLTPTDIGADAGNFLLADVSGPGIAYTPLVNGCGTGDISLTSVLITDGTGIPLAGSFIPRIYYRKNAGTYFSRPGVLSSGGATNSIWNFTIVVADMGGIVAGDVIDYYVIAQDNLGLIGSNAGGAVATDVNTVTTHPVTPNNITVLSSLNGTYTVGVGGNFTTLTAAVAAYNTGCLNGPVLFSLTDATYPTETFPITINSNASASSVNTLTIKPAAGANPTISGLSATALIVLNGADWVTIDGSNGNTPNTICPPSSATRNLTITNTSTGTTSAVIWFQTVTGGPNGATNNRVINCNIAGNGPLQTLCGIGMGSATISTASLGTNNNANQFINNNISKAQYGIISQGFSAFNKNTGNVMNQNLMNTAAPNNLSTGGIFVTFEDVILISGNNISNLAQTSSPDVCAINVGFIHSGLSTTTFAANECTNSTISNNIIGSVINSGTFSAGGIALAQAASGTTLITNNMIYGVAANGTASDFAGGIILGGGTGTTINVFHNTVWMQGTVTGASAGTTVSAALAVTNSTPPSNLNIKNNILANTQLGNTGASTKFMSLGLAYSSQLGNYTGLNSDNNDLYCTGAGPGSYQIGITGSLTAGIPRITLANWRTETGRDLNSFNILPNFVSTTDVHLAPATNQCLDGGGMPVGILTDIDCQTRSLTTPDIGADEFTNPASTLTVTENSGIAPNDGIICSGASATLTATGGGTYLWSTGETTAIIIVSPTMNTTYTVTITVGTCTDILSTTITVTPSPSPTISVVETSGLLPNDGITCAGGSVTLTANPAGLTYAWSTGATTQSIMVAPLVTTLYSLTVTNANACTGVATQTITVNAVPAFTSVVVNPTSCTSNNGSITLTMTGGVAPFTFTWSTLNGCGLVAGAQNQSNLCAGTYNVTVTSSTTGCTTTGAFSLDGPPPGCFSCPTVGPLTASPSTVCPNSTTTLTVTGLAGMGVVYGITFKYFTSVPADPYVGGTVIATIPNGSLGGGGTTATTTTSFALPNTYLIYAILSPTPTDPSCRPSSTTNVVVNPSPNVNPVSNMTYCAGSTVPSIVFTSNTNGAVFSWSRTNEPIGLATNSGTGNIPSFTATNAGTAPITATFSVVASFTGNGVTCTGTPIQFTITVNPNPIVNPVTSITVCAGATVPVTVFTSNVPGAVFSWSRTVPTPDIGLGITSGTGNVPSFVATNTSIAPIVSTFSVVASFTNNGVTCTGTPIQFTIRVNPVPTVNVINNLVVCAGTNVPSIVFGSNIPGVTFNWTRTIPVPDIGAIPASGSGNFPAFLATNTSGAPITSTVTVTATFTGTNVACPGPPRTFTITVNPSPTVTQVPNQTYCFGQTVPGINFTSNVPGVTISWTRTGPFLGLTPMSGTGNIPSFPAINNTTGPLVNTFMVMATYTNGGISCTGPVMTFTITVCYQMLPNILGDAYVCPGQIQTYFVENPNPNSVYTWVLQNGGGTIVTQSNNSITIEWSDSGGPYSLQLIESGCGANCSAADFLNVFIQGLDAIACNDHVQISLDTACLAFVESGMILEGENPFNNNYYVELHDEHGNLIPMAVLTSDYLGQLIQAKVINECNGQSCWGTITLEDKIPPSIQCTDATLPCGSSLEPIYEPQPIGTDIQSSYPALPIGPNAGTITNAPITLSLPAGSVVTDVNLTVDLDHTFSSDLRAELISPNGTTVLLVNALCGGSDNWDNVTFDDQAAVAIACNPTPPPAIAAGSYRPQQALSVLNGELANGTWTLRITDQANIDGGVLNLFTLSVGYIVNGPYAPSAHDACGEVNLAYTDSSTGDACEAQIVSRTWTATDQSGNKATCVQTFTITPLHLSDVILPPAYIGECGESTLPENTGWPTANGNVLTDANDHCNIFIGYWDLNLNDCGGGVKIARHWTILDWCTQQVSKGIQVIKLGDTKPPVLQCPADFTVGTDFWYCYANVSVPKPSATDACSDIVSYELSSADGYVVAFGNNYVVDQLSLGTHTLTWIVTDECGNSSTCSFHITVADDVPPVANCDLHTIVSLTNDGPKGITLVPAEVFNDGSYDNCGPVTFRARRMDSCIDFDWTTEGACIDDVPGGVPPVNSRDRGTVHRPCVPFACCDVGAGPIMIELEVTDQAGNHNYCMVEAIVQDKISPFVECPPDIIVSCDFWFNVQEGTFVDGEGNNNGNLDEDPLSPVFGNMFDAFRYNDDQSVRQDIIINDPHSDIQPQPHNWGIDGWADDNCEVNLQVRVRIVDDCSGGTLPGNAPEGAVKLIERRFSASDGNDGVAPGTCTQRIWVVDYDPFYITDTNCNNPNPNDGVIWPCDILFTNCPEDLGDTGEPTLFDDACSLVAATYEDERFDFVDGACFKILRHWKVIDWCQYNSQTGYGLWEYIQVIKVHDQTGPEFTNCPAGPVTLCVADQGVSLPDNNQAFLGEDNPNSSSCSVHLNLHQIVHETCSDLVNFDVKLYPFNGDEYWILKPTTTVTVDENNNADLSFDTRQNSIQSIRLNGIPYNSPYCGDYHRILWTAEDGCGNITTCEYLIRLEDCKLPSPVCINGLSTVVMPVGGQVTIWAKDFNASSFDDCTAEADLLYSFSGDTYQPSYTYTCDNVPQFGVELSVEIWVADGGTDDNCNGQISWNERNKDYCTTTIVITDNAGVCGDTTGTVLIDGEILTEHDQPVQLVTVNIACPGIAPPPYVTSHDGLYTFGLLPMGEMHISAERNDNPRNGVSTLDLVIIQKHLLGIEPLANPYDLIAADANNSQSVSAIDLVELRKLILGVWNELPNNKSWRFIDKNFAFEDPSHPWPYDEVIDITTLPEMQGSHDFVGVKIGDVNNSVQANVTQLFPRNANGLVHFVTDEQSVTEGAQIDVPIRSSDFSAIEGYQFTLKTSGLQFVGVESGVLTMSEENLGIFDGELTASWNKSTGVTAKRDEVLFTLHFEARRGGHLSDMLEINSQLTEAEAYNTFDEVKDLKLVFNGQHGIADFALYQNIPNPFKENTVIGYEVPVAGQVTLTLFDATGKTVLTKQQNAVKGYNTVLIQSKELGNVGVLYYRLDAGAYTATKKMILMQ
ncbi:MAG TPA: proprotein convertase P-domain-containing protein [Saprospiraceae bacterium]|nr:proprotein convertase P-domain-containing protein [Saprospiraceae bacterium]